MKKIIHHLRRQSEETRRHILHVSTLICGIILALVWIYSLGTTISNPDNKGKMPEDLKPFSALKDNIVNGYNDLSTPSTDNTTQ